MVAEIIMQQNGDKMEKLVIHGGKPLFGDIEVSGMKNAALPVILATILIDDKCVIENIPNVSDVSLAFEIIQSMGGTVRRINKTTAEIDTRNVKQGISPYELCRKMRGSYYIVGAELGRFGRGKVGLPGGCDLGVRPIDQHIKGFEALGAEVNIESGYIEAVAAEKGLTGSNIYFDAVTVGGTLNVMIAATRAKGVTIIENAAREPHIVDLANFLNTCGAKISGAGTDTIKITGVEKLKGCTYAIIPDMIEAGTFMIAAAVTGGKLNVRNVIPKHLESISAKMEEMGITVEEYDDYVTVYRKEEKLSRINLKTLPYPGFPTDMGPQMCVLMCQAQGVSLLNEGIFSNRFRYVDELRRMGACIKVDDKTAIIEGGQPLSAANLRAVDLRAGAAVVLAALIANGRTEIEDIYHIERGYDNLVDKLRGVGANIKKVVLPDPSVYDKAL